MEKENINQIVLQVLLDLRGSSINNIFKGKSPWRLKHLSKLAKYFGVTTDWLIFGDRDYINKFNYEENLKTKQSIKDFLVNEGHYQTYGKLQAKGFFKELEK